MNRFIVNTFWGGIFLFIAIIIMDVFMLSFKNRWSMYSHERNVIDSYNKLHSLKDSNKIIIISGSNGAFGLNSRMINKVFDMPVVNTSSTADIGVRMQFEIYKEFMHKGDIVVLTPEYGGGYDRLYGGSALLRVISTFLPKAYLKISLRQWIYVYKYIGIHFDNAINTINDMEFDGPYSDKYLNEFGDVECKRPHKDTMESISINGEVVEAYIAYLKSIFSYADQKGINLILLPPTLREFEFKALNKQIDSISYILKSNNICFSASPSRYSYPDSLYFDTPYHMTEEGANKRTEDMIEDIRKILCRH